MPDCSHIRSLVPLLALDDLTDRERATLESHLTHCASCRQDRERCAQWMPLLLDALHGVEAPASFQPRELLIPYHSPSAPHSTTAGSAAAKPTADELPASWSALATMLPNMETPPLFRAEEINTMVSYGLPRQCSHAPLWGKALAAAGIALLLGGLGVRLWQWLGGVGEDLSQRHREHGGEQLVVSSGMGGSPMIPANSLAPPSLAELPVVHAPSHDPSDPSDLTDHSHNPLAGVSGMGILPMIPALSPLSPPNEAASPPSAAAPAASPTISAAGTEPAALATEKPAALAPHKEEEAGMTATQKLAAAVSAAALTGMAGLHPANVTDVTVEQPDYTRLVKVSYKTDGPGIATCRFLDEGEPIGVPGQIATFDGDIHRYLTDAEGGTYTFVWNAGRDIPEEKFDELTVEIKLWSTNNPPEYCAVWLVKEGDTLPIRWYGSESEVPDGVSANTWKTDRMLLRKIPATTQPVLLGSPSDETGRNKNREGQRWVSITAPFYMGVYQVTQCQWYQIWGSQYSKFAYESDKHTRPVECVSYYQIRESGSYNQGDDNYAWPGKGHDVAPNSFMGKLRARTGGLIAFDLPTNAQWEYACRAGTFGPWNNGADPALLARYSTNGGTIPEDYTEATVPADLGGTARVGSYLPNAWGLYDMHGNVYEWCLDWFDNIPDEAIPEWAKGSDPEGPVSGSNRVNCGGYWSFVASNCRSACRYDFTPSSRYYSIGLRVAAAAVVTP